MLKFFQEMLVDKNKLKKYKFDEKVRLICDKFSQKIKNQYDFDNVDVIIEDSKDVKYGSETFKVLSKHKILVSVKSEFELEKYFNENGFKDERSKILIFLISRNFFNLKEHHILIGFIYDNYMDEIYFKEELSSPLFSHFKCNNTYIYGKELTKSHIHSYAYYSYKYKEDKLLYTTNIVLDQTFNSLNLRLRKESEIFPNERTHVLSFELKIDSQNKSVAHVGFLTYKDEIIRTLNFNITDDITFSKAIDKMLFPYNLDNKLRIEIGLENTNISEAKNIFEEKFKLYEMIKV